MNSLFGILFHALGGLSASSFYVPYKSVKHWTWEIYWIIGGFFSWIIVPLLVCFLSVQNIGALVNAVHFEIILWPLCFGLMWGIGGLTFGLTIKYLGVSLGISLSLGLTAAFGTLIPPFFDGSYILLFSTKSGIIVLSGIILSLIGTYFIGNAGYKRDKYKVLQNFTKKTKPPKNIKKGIIFAIISGILSACFAFGIASGKSILELTSNHVRHELFINSFLYVFILFGGFITNFIYCFFVIFNNNSFKTFTKVSNIQFNKNMFFCALGGTIWYTQFLFYGMGTTLLDDFEFASWSLHISFIIFFSTLWGIILKEWKNTQPKVKKILSIGLFLLVISSVLIGFGNSNI